MWNAIFQVHSIQSHCSILKVRIHFNYIVFARQLIIILSCHPRYLWLICDSQHFLKHKIQYFLFIHVCNEKKTNRIHSIQPKARKENTKTKFGVFLYVSDVLHAINSSEWIEARKFDFETNQNQNFFYPFFYNFSFKQRWDLYRAIRCTKRAYFTRRFIHPGYGWTRYSTSTRL